MILNGLGGRALSRQHARNSARLMNAAQPSFFPRWWSVSLQGDGRFRQGYEDFEPLPLSDLLVELEWLLGDLQLRDTVFRSDHASNYLVLKGTLGADKPRLMRQLREAIDDPRAAPLRRVAARAVSGRRTGTSTIGRPIWRGCCIAGAIAGFPTPASGG